MSLMCSGLEGEFQMEVALLSCRPLVDFGVCKQQWRRPARAYSSFVICLLILKVSCQNLLHS